MPGTFHIAFLLEDTDLSGSVRLPLMQGDALVARGHRVTFVTKGPPLTWRASRGEWIHVGDFAEARNAGFDFAIGTSWTTVEPALELAGPRAVHLCQACEGSSALEESQKSRIDAVFSLPVPKLAATRKLEELCRRMHDDVTFVGQIVDSEIYRARTPSEHEPSRVLLVGAGQIDSEGIFDGYGAVTHARWYGRVFDLVRVSPWAPSADEPVSELVQEFHVALSAEELTRVIHSCDIYVGTARRETDFGLPAAEALAAGLPSVLTKIPSYLSFGEPHDFAAFAEEGDAEEIGDRLIEVLDDENLRETLRRRGREVAAQFHAEHSVRRIEEFLRKRDETLRGA